MELLASGAEAEVYRGEYLGKPAVIKIRPEKRYRHPSLDRLLRIRRTRIEASILIKAKRMGVPCPAVLDVWGDTIVMEEVRGTTLASVLEGGESPVGVDELGRVVAKLHAAGIVHNDLTPLNVIFGEGERVCLIDFGLARYSRSVEDRAVDLHVFEQSVTGLAPSAAPEVISTFFSSYSREAPDAASVLSRVEDIRRRGRYKRGQAKRG